MQLNSEPILKEEGALRVELQRTRRKNTFGDDEGGGGGGDGGGVWAPCRVARAAWLVCTWGPPTAYSLPSSRRCSARLRFSTRLPLLGATEKAPRLPIQKRAESPASGMQHIYECEKGTGG